MSEAFLCSGCFTICMGAQFSVVEMDNTIWFIILSGPLEGVKVPVAQFQMVLRSGRVFQYTSVPEVLVRSIDTDFNYVITMLQSNVQP